MIELTPRALEVVRAATQAARRFGSDAFVRVGRAGGGVAFELTEEAAEGDRVIESEDLKFFAQGDLEGTIDVGEHNAPLLLPD